MEGGALSKITPKGPFSISAVNQKVIGSNPVWGAKYFPLRNSLRLLVNSGAAFTWRNGPYSRRQAALILGNIARCLAETGSPPPFQGETLRVSVDQCTFG